MSAPHAIDARIIKQAIGYRIIAPTAIPATKNQIRNLENGSFQTRGSGARNSFLNPRFSFVVRRKATGISGYINRAASTRGSPAKSGWTWISLHPVSSIARTGSTEL
jgi:hypothetical protein